MSFFEWFKLNIISLISITVTGFLSFYLIKTTKAISERQNELDKRKLKLDLFPYKKKFFDALFDIITFSRYTLSDAEYCKSYNFNCEIIFMSCISMLFSTIYQNSENNILCENNKI